MAVASAKRTCAGLGSRRRLITCTKRRDLSFVRLCVSASVAIDLQALARAVPVAVSELKGTHILLGQFQGLCVAVTHQKIAKLGSRFYEQQ